MILPGATLGLLGGGQLGRMFAHAAQAMGYRVAVLEPSTDCPAKLPPGAASEASAMAMPVSAVVSNDDAMAPLSISAATVPMGESPL